MFSKNKILIYFAVVLVLSVLMRFYIYLNFQPFVPASINIQDQILFLDLININLNLSIYVIILAGLINVSLLYILSSRIFSSKIGLVTALIYGLCPWGIYLEIFGSIYVIFLLICLISLLGLELLTKGQYRLGFLLFISSCVLIVYSSVSLWLILGGLIFGIIHLKLLNINLLKVLFISLMGFVIPLLILMFINQEELRNNINREFGIFNEIGLINAVNSNRGEILKSQYSVIGRIIENKYIYYSQHITFNVLKHFSPSLYFTPQEKLSSFSFSPPIYLGLIIPFLFGLGFLNSFQRKIILLSFLLFIPSLLSKKSPDLNKLILFFPIIIFLIGIGFSKFLKNKKVFYTKLLLVLSLVLVFFQIAVTLIDISIKEPQRIQAFLR